MMTVRVSVLFVVCSLLPALCPEKICAAEVRLEKVVSHEDAKFEVARSRLTVGREQNRLRPPGGNHLRDHAPVAGTVGGKKRQE